MSKGKTWQRVASAFLAAVMTFSTFSTTIAYAAEATTDSSITTDAVSDTDATEEVDATDSAASSSTTEGEVAKPEATEAPAATETPDETDATEPEETPAPTEAPTPTPESTESPEATAEPEPTEEPEETETPDVSESDFVAVGLADDATEGQIDAEIGDEITFNAHVNRDDVNLQYQWYKRFIEPQTAEYDEDLMEYDYGGDEPTAYGFLVEGKTPAEVLAENPDAGWSGIELYRAVVSAMEAIGADTSNVNIEFGTRNYALEGFTITATMVDGNVVISADKDNEHATGTLNENNEFAFAESTNNDIAVQPAEVQTEEEVDPDSLEANGWEAIEGATSDTYTHTVDEYDAYTTYRCVITIADDDYIAAAKKALVALGADESKLTDDALDNTFMSEITIHIPSMDASEDDIYNDLSVEDKLKQRLALSGIATYAAGVQLDSQSNPQWVTGLSAGMEYLTADMYAKLYGQDGKGGWLAEGKVTPEQADRYWSKITSSGFSTYAVANELDSEGLPTGATRQYSSFTLTDGKLEINSEWYGKTVYFRYYNPNIVGNTATGTAVSIPAAGRGTSYKDAVQVLFCYVVEENGITLPLTIKEYVTQATHNGYSANGLAHITLNTISANKFNVDPDRYLKDAEGNYRNDSVYWGTCYYSEPDLSGKAYYALKNFIGNGYGFGIGHDTMYAYAGAYFDAYGGGSGYPNVKYTEKNIDPNDTATRYYSVNSYKVNTGHWNMNALMGENNSNTLVGSGYYSASDEEYFGWIVDPLTVPSAIMSSGGSHGPFAKSTIYGGRRLYIRTNGGYTYEQAMANADIKHRTPTNWPYKFNQGDTIPAALTHSNGQVAFDDIWVQYNGCASDFTDAGLGKLYEPTVDGRQGTNNFYLAGSGNFVMNQIGHLPIDNGNGSWNNASTEEMQLCVNTLMWISQRKQCEVCAADQGDQQMTHFVHRVNTANAKKILTALANGGSYWYSLNDCYELMEDLNLQKLGFNSANWKPIKNFTGHWNSKYFDVKVPRDAALFDNTTGTLGAYRTGDGNDWNLGTNKKNGWDTVFKDSGSSAPSVRTTGIARIYGKLGDAKLFNDGQIHEGYTVHIRYEDNLELLQEGDDFTYTKAHNYDYVNGGYDMEHTDTGAELWLDYNISIHANEREQVGCGLDQHSIFMYPDLTIEAPNGLRYIMTRYQIVKEFPYGITRETSRTTYSSSDKPEIDTSVRYQGAMQTATRRDMTAGAQPETINVQGKTMAELGIEVDGRGWLKDTDEDYAPYLKNGYALYSKYSYPKEIWQWFWRNAVKYHCYDMEEYDGTNEQVFFYIDEKNVRAADQSFDANSGAKPFSSWTAPFDATYQIDLWGAGGGGVSQEFPNHTAAQAESGGHVTITADIKEGTTLYFVAGGAGNSGSGVAVDLKDPGNACGGTGGYNGGGSGGSSARMYDCVAYDKDDEGHGTPDTTYHSMDPVGYGGGGGATTVATRLAGADGQLKNYEGDTSALLGVAGGGSGASGGGRGGYAGFAIGGSGSSHDGEGWIFHCSQTKTMTIQCDWGPETYEHGDVCAAAGVDSGKFAGHNELRNDEDYAKIDATRSEGGGGAGYQAAAVSGAARGTSYVSGTTTLESGNIIIKSSSTDDNGSAAGNAGRAKIKVVNLDQRLYRRVGKNAMDIGFQDSNECHPTNVKVKLTVANKMYDGTPVVVAKSIVWDKTDAGIPESVLNDIDIVYSNNESANITKPTNASTDSKKKPLVRTGSYTATAIYRGTKYNVTFCWENTLPGKTYVVRGESTTPDQYMSGEGNVVYFDIYPRPLYLYSYNNDKIYDNISTAKVKDIKIEGPTQNSGIVNGDAVDLNTRLAYGYYCDAYAPEDYATASFREQLHTGLHSIKTVTILELVNNPFDNYYIAKEDFTGTINPRPLYVHSQYHDTNKYKWNYDGNSNDIGNNKYLTDTVPYDGQNMTVEQAYEAILAGKRENIDITRYTKTEQDNYQNTVVNPNNIKVYDSYYNAAIGEKGQGNIYIDNITNYDAVALNAQTYVGSYADSNAGEQLTGYDSNGDNGVIKADRYNGLSTNTIRHLPYSVKYSYSTPNPQVGQKMTVTIAVTNKDQGYGLAAQNNYVAPVAIQNLRLKSRFAGNGPITLKSTNGIRMNQNGTEFYIDTIPVGGTVNIVFEYTVQDIDDLNALVRTIEQNNEMYLVNNNYNDYYIADKTFSGGIYRTTLRAQVKSESTTYGFGFKGKLPYADDVYYWNKGSDSWLTMEGLVEDHKTAAQDDEKLDLKAKNTNQYKSEFVYKLVPSETTDAGSYPVKYIGLNEFNYDLLKNYVVTEDPGSIEVRPRKIMVSVDESQKIYGTTNPFFNSTFKVLGTDAQGNELDMTDENNWTVLGDDSTVDYNNMKLIGGDTVGNVVEVINGAARSPLAFTNGVSNLPYLTTATQNSDVIYQTDVPAEDCAYCLEKYNEMHKGHEHYHDDDHPHSHVPVNGYPVSVNENAGYGSTLGIKTVTNSEGQTVSNYELVYESNVLKIHPRLIRIAAIDATKAYGGTEPALKWVVDGEIIKPTSEMLGIKAVRDSGENVRDAGYTIRIAYEKSTANNYIVETNNATMTITPVPLTIVFGNQERYYGEENPNDYRLDVIGLKHGDTVDTALKNNDGATAKVLETAKKTLSDYIDLTYNKFTDVGSNYLYGDKSYCEEHTILVPRENADGGYNYTVASYTPGVLTIKPRPMLLTVTGWQKELGDKDKVQDFTLTDMITHNSISGQQKLGAGSRITDASVVVNPDKVPIVFNLVRAEGEEVGSYPVYSTPQDRQIGNLAANDQKQLELDNPNYDFEYRYANDLIVKRQGLMITVDDKVRYYGDRVNRFYDGSTDYTYHVFKVENGTAVEITAEEAGINTNSFTFTHLDTQTSSSGTYKGCISLSGVHSTIYDDDDITITAGNLTIIPRPVSVVAEDNTKVYGDADPELKYTLHDGVRGDDGNYTVTVSNKGKADAENVVIEDFFDGTGTLNFIPMDGVKDNGDNTYTISSVKVGESIELHFTYVVTVSDAPQVLNAAVVKDPTPPIDVEKDADKYVAKFHVLRKDRDALPKEVKGIYSGDEFPEYKNANTLTIGGKTYIEGLDYEVISSGKHTKIEVCPACKKLSILYAKGMCKACAQRTLYRHTEAKPEKAVETPSLLHEANVAFRQKWPVNIICGLDRIRYDIDNYPYTKKEETKIVNAIMKIEDKTITDYLLKHYKDGVRYSDMATAKNTSKQNEHGFGKRRLAYVRSILNQQGLLKGSRK